MTQFGRALKGEITPEMKQVAMMEGVFPDFVRDGVASGTIVIPRNTGRKNMTLVGIGAGLKTKVSASVGLYGREETIPGELAKIRAAVEAGTDAIMDLSVNGGIDVMRREALALCPKPVGTLPLYQALAEAGKKYRCAVCGDQCAAQIAARYFGID